MSSYTARAKHLVLVLGLLFAGALALMACGSDPVTNAEPPAQQPDAGAAEPTSPADADEDSAESPDGGGSAPSDGATWERTASRDDLISLQPAVIDHLVVDDDGQTLLVRYINSAEPCSGAKVTATESDTEIVVELEVGLDPNSAAMSCIAAVFNYEIAVPLDAPVGDREVVYTDVPPGASAPGGDVAGDMSRFEALSFDEAVAVAEQEGRVWRLGREDDEIFPVTMDYNPERVTFEVDDGIVTLAVAG